MRVKSIWPMAFIMLASIVLAQEAPQRPLRRLQHQPTRLVARWVDREENKQHRLLEPLLPFAEAVEKAKSGDPQGFYALAIHCAKGEAIDLDLAKARQFMQKASDMNYSNAVFVVAMLLDADSATAKDCNSPASSTTPRINQYLGDTHFRVWQHRPSLSVTNEVDVAKIRAGYERAINLGVSVATNELARFERRVEAAQSKAKKEAEANKQKIENAKLIEGIL